LRTNVTSPIYDPAAPPQVAAELVRPLTFDIAMKISLLQSVPTKNHNMLEPDQWDSVLGSVTGTIYRRTGYAAVRVRATPNSS
jgi:hypothetical protein